MTCTKFVIKEYIPNEKSKKQGLQWNTTPREKLANERLLMPSNGSDKRELRLEWSGDLSMVFPLQL